MKSPFVVIDGTPPPDTPQQRIRKRLRKQEVPPYLARCHRCTGTAMIEIKLGMEIYCGKPRGGQKQLICALCFARGEHVVVHF